MSSPSVSDVSFDRHPAPHTVTLAWTLRRAALGLVILLGAAAFGAWVMHASIEPDAAGAAVHGEYAVPSN